MKMDETAMGKIFILKAVTNKGSIILKKIISFDYSDKERLVMTINAITDLNNNDLLAELKFTDIFNEKYKHILEKNPKHEKYFRNLTIENVYKQIQNTIKKYGGQPYDIEISIRG